MPITLTSSALEVEVRPERGADIVQIRDLATGIPVLTVSPTADVTTAPSLAGDSMTRWLTGYPGGWQLLAPNADSEREHDGVRQGYHGEAALSSWRTVARTTTSAELVARLITAPLELRRSIRVDGPELVVTDTVVNLSDVPVTSQLVQHPAFGAPFLDEHSYLVTGAGTLITDAAAPGTLAAADLAGPPATILPAGPVPSSLALPGPGARASLFAALTDFPDPEVAVLFASPTHGFGMELRWERDAYPVAWFWIEANEGAGWPWFRRMYAIAVEPGNVIPGEGSASDGSSRGGDGVEIAGGGAFSSTVSLRRVPLDPRP